MGADVLAAIGAAALPDDLKALGQDGLKVFHGPSFHQHVPVTAGRLRLLRRRRFPAGSDRYRSADTTLPRTGKFRLSCERHAKMVPIRAVESNILTGREVSVTVILVTCRTEPGAAECAFSHACCLPGGQRYYSSTLNTRTRFPLRALPNRVSARRSQLSGPRLPPPAAEGALLLAPGVPLTPLDEDIAKRFDVVGHEPVGAQVQEPGHLGPVVDRPHVHVEP
jgi:hypothetical protein